MRYVNPIWVTGDIEKGNFFTTFTRRYSEIMQTTSSGSQMTVYINSKGGDIDTTLGIYDLIKYSGRHTVGVVAGTAESGASLFLQACSMRVMTPHSSLVLHKSTVTVHGSVENARAALARFHAIDERFYAIYAERAGRKLAAIEEMAFRDLHFSAQEAVQAGLADAVLTFDQQSPRRT